MVLNDSDEIINGLREAQVEHGRFSGIMQSFQLVFAILFLILVVVIFVMIYKLFGNLTIDSNHLFLNVFVFSTKAILKRISIEKEVNNASNASNGDNQFEVTIGETRQQSVANNGSEVTDNKPDFDGTYGRQSNARRIYDMFRFKTSKTSEVLESIPESSEEQQSIRPQELWLRMSPGSEVRSGRGSDRSSPSDSSLLSDMITKIDSIIDQSFDAIINSVIDNNQQSDHSSDDD